MSLPRGLYPILLRFYVTLLALVVVFNALYIALITLTTSPIPLPSILIFSYSTVLALFIAGFVASLALLIYLGVGLLRFGYGRGAVPIAMIILFVIGLMMIRLNPYASLALLTIAYIMLASTYAVLASLALRRASMWLWRICMLIILLAVPIMLTTVGVAETFKVAPLVVGALTILASTIEAETITRKMRR